MKYPILTATTCCLLSAAIFLSCTKEANDITRPNTTMQDASISSDQSTAKKGEFRTFVIEEGHHFCNNNFYPPFRGKSLFFTAIFNKSAIYHFTDPQTKDDLNTLYGFADNFERHEQFSARFGWRWFDNELQLFAYVINNGNLNYEKIASVALNEEIKCGIVVNNDRYDFYLNGILAKTLPRTSSTRVAVPYKLFPYFGGNAVAPHRITIKIRED